MAFKDKQSPQTYDETGQYRSRDTGDDDRNKAWQAQQKTSQQMSKSDGGMEGVPGSNKTSSNGPGPFTDKDQNRGLKETILNKPLMSAGFVGGGLGILYMLAKAMKK